MATLQLRAVLKPGKAKYVEVTVDNYTETFKVDSGAEVSVISKAFPILLLPLNVVDDLLTGPADQALRVLRGYTSLVGQA